MKIAFFVDAFPVLSETFILNQITGLIDRGHNVDVFARNRREYATHHADIDHYRLVERTCYLDSPPAGVGRRMREWAALVLRAPRWLSPRGISLAARVVRARGKTPPFSTLSLLRIASRELESGRYDIVHCQYGTLGRSILPLLELGAIHGALVTSFRGHDITQKDKFSHGYYAALFRAGVRFLPVSRSLEQRLLSLGCPPERISVLHSGIDCARFRYKERRRPHGEPTVIVTIARLVEMKGLQYAIAAVAELLKSGHRVVYHIVGDGPLRDEITRQIATLGIEAHIHLHGWMAHEEAMTVLDGAHVMLAPSVTAANGETEGIPNAVKEALAVGLPVVATRHSGTPELVEDTVSGFLVPERDVPALSAALAQLCDHPERWPAMGSAGRAHVVAEFDKNALNDRLVALYREAARAVFSGGI